MHVGLVSLTDIDYGLDLANALNDRGACVSLYMSRSHVARAVGSIEHPVERVYELGLLPPTVSLTLFQPPRMRDPRSFLVAVRLCKAMKRDGAEVAHILVGSGEL